MVTCEDAAGGARYVAGVVYFLVLGLPVVEQLVIYCRRPTRSLPA
jgi:hypothetical protein